MEHRHGVPTNLLQVMEHGRQMIQPVLRKIVVDVPAAFVWSYPYTYLFNRSYSTMLLLEKIVSKDLNSSILTTLPVCIIPYGLNTKYITCDYAPTYDVT